MNPKLPPNGEAILEAYIPNKGSIISCKKCKKQLGLYKDHDVTHKSDITTMYFNHEWILICTCTFINFIPVSADPDN